MGAQMSANRKDFLNKLELIQRSGHYALRETPPGLAEQHIRLMISLARYLATEVELCR
jgi:hypothetical protein